MVQRLSGGAGDDTFRIKSGRKAVEVAAGDGFDTLIVDWSDKTGSINSNPAYGPRSHGPAWLDAGDGDRVAYGDLIDDGVYRALERLILKAGSGDDVLFGGAARNEIHAGAGNDRVYGLGGDDVLFGGAGDDVLVGDFFWFDGGRDRLYGGDGNDVLIGGGGDDLLWGGRGFDTAVYSGARADYEIVRIKAGWRVTDLRGDDGTDHVYEVERLQFADGFVDLPNEKLGLAGRLYLALTSHPDWGA